MRRRQDQMALAQARACIWAAALLVAAACCWEECRAADPLEIGSRRELFVDDWLIDRFEGKAELRLQRPIPREIVLIHDAPWEGSGCGYHTVFRDGNVIRMYYIAADLTSEDGTELGTSRPIYACY